MSANSQDEKFWVTELRHLRHDFLNHLQLVSGMLQVGKPAEHVVEYITELSASIKQLGRLFELPDPRLAAVLARQLMLLVNAEYQIETRVVSTGSKPVTEPCFNMLQAVCELLCQAADLLDLENRLLEVTVSAEQGQYKLQLALPYAQTELAHFLAGHCLLKQYKNALKVDSSDEIRLTLNLSEKQSR